MPGEPLALSTVPPPATADTDYDAICAAVTATARGRWFLDEFAKRNRYSDTSQVLSAIARMEAAVVGERARQASHQANQEVRIELLEMARTIAQTRADVAESRPDASQHLAGEAAGESAPDVAAAAERLRQIAWTMRACGIDLPASDQIGQIADTILSADALRNLGDRRAHRLTEALHYLEHRIDRMLDSHLAAAAAVATDVALEVVGDIPLANANGANDNDHRSDAAVLTLAAPTADDAPTPETKAATEAPPSAEDHAAAAAFAAEANATEFTIDDDVVLTVAVSTDGPEPRSEPRPDVALSPEPATEPAAPDILMREPVSAASTAEPVRHDASIALPIPATNSIATARQDERAGRLTLPQPIASLQTAAANVDEDTDAGFGDLEHVPLVVVPAAATLQGGLPSLAAQEAHQEAVQQSTHLHAQEFSDDELSDDEFSDEPAAAAASTAGLVADEPAAELSRAGAKATDAVAMQVYQDLDDLADAAPIVSTVDAGPARKEEPVRVRHGLETAARADDPADFLLEGPPEASPNHAPVAALVASAQATRAQLTTALAAIETELLAPPLPARADAPAAPRPPRTDGPLAALMALSEEERLALFS